MTTLGDVQRPLLLLLLLVGLTHGASEVFVVKDSNGTACIMANFSATFWTSYKTGHGSQNASFSLPSSAEVLISNSSCGENPSESILTIGFRKGYSLTFAFARNVTRYQVKAMKFTYNLSDTEIFPNASSKDIKVEESVSDIEADIDKKYRCVSAMQIQMQDVIITFHDTTIQAYLSNSTFSKEETRCKQDEPSPTTAPPSPLPPLVPTNPSVFRYNMTGDNGTCLLASMALQLNISYLHKDNTTVTRVLNINPNETLFDGSCSAQLVTLSLRNQNQKGNVLVLQFGMNASSSVYFLQGIQLNMTLPDARDPTFRAVNSSLRALQTTIGNSYKCSTEEHIPVTKEFSLNVFSIWVQAFKVEGDRFGSVEECVQDGNNMLIPIAVGGALAGLVLIVLIAYLIGRKRSHAGYQTI
uniref:Lysosome-associated membrane glycoprotein 1 n=1 Tax=Jaculus jaculus TaxID=51337 RepID=A0A8C5LIF4_JACJA|nr:lysosome-associated membrane glycoprotein 1 isoform X2 [Jaculus jaculus]